jgi:hypothetical protein
MNENTIALELLAEIFKDVPQISDKTPSDRIDQVAGLKVRWENGVDVRVSIDLLRKVQALLKT